MSMCKGATSANFLQPGPSEKDSFFVPFRSFSRLGGTPGASRGTLGTPSGLKVDFFMIFGCPRGGFGAPFGPLGPPVGPHLRPKGRKKSEKERCVHPSRSQGDFRSEKGAAGTLTMWLNHSKYLGSRKGPLSRICSPKVCPGTAKYVLLLSIWETEAIFGRTLDDTLRSRARACAPAPVLQENV